MTIFFCFFFYFLVCKASSILSHSQFPRNPAKLRHESVKYRDYLFFVQTPEGSIASRLRPHQSLHSYCSYIFEKPNRPRCASGEAYCSFGPKSSKLTSPKTGNNNNEICSLRPNYLLSNYVFYIYCISLHFFGTRG